MQAQVDQFVKRHHLIPHGSTIVVGVSGGPDSMALLYYLKERSKLWDLTLIVCSINHQLRGEESQKDLEYVSIFCEGNGLTFVGRSVDVQALMAKEQMGTEEAARICRYQVFEEVMNAYRANLLALAHHGDDQIETMIMRQVRGSFGISKAGIPITRPIACGMLIRPFLSITKNDIELYCKTHGIIPRYDKTNESDDYTRNRFRKVILPFLKKENPRVHVHFQKESELMTEDYRYLDELAQKALPKIIEEKTTNTVKLSINCLLGAPVPLQRRMIHLILNYLYKQTQLQPEIQFVHIELLLQWLGEKRASGMMNLPNNIEVERSYDDCIIRTEHLQEAEGLRRSIKIPGKTEWPLGHIKAEVKHTYFKEYQGLHCFICDFDKVAFPLTVRNREQGDRFHPVGIKGTKKLKSLFIDQKVPRSMREKWPVIVDGNDEVIWVPLLGHGDYAVIEPSTTHFLILTFVPTDNFRRICNEGRFTGNTLY
jgi:tRNA(Ile)-lysidine synthase